MASWATAADAEGQHGCRDSTLQDHEWAPFLDAATEVLFVRSGRQFGTRTVTVRPCATQGLEPSWGRVAAHQGWCSCSLPPRRCGCGDGPSHLRLGVGAIQSVVEVLVDGVVLSPSSYRVDEATWLVRLPDIDGTARTWPATQRLDLDDTEEGTWSVTVLAGVGVPELGRQAAAELACELSRAGSDGCRLDPRVVSVDRHGTTFQLTGITEALQVGRIGLPTVDLFLDTYNPKGLRRRARVLFPPPSTPPRRVDGPGGS